MRSVLGLIPARGGSKGIPRKNIRPLGGKPLLEYTVESARAARRIQRVVVSTEDEEIGQVARDAGADVPFLRPVSLAQDDTPTLAVVQHALRALEELGDRYDAVCLLQPTSPFRPAGLIDACIELLECRGADAVITVLPVPAEYNPRWVYFTDPTGALAPALSDGDPVPRRQDLPAAFHREGSVYVTLREVVMVGNSLYGRRLMGYEVSPHASVNIDGWEDWERAEELARRRH